MKKNAAIFIAIIPFLFAVGCGTTVSSSSTDSGSSGGSDSTPVQSTTTPSTTSASSTSSSGQAASSTPLSTLDPSLKSRLSTDANQFQALEQQYNTARQQSANGDITNEQFDQDLQALIPQFQSLANDIQTCVPLVPSNLETTLQLFSASAQDFDSGLETFDDAIQQDNESEIPTANSYIQKSNTELIQFISQWKQATGQN